MTIVTAESAWTLDTLNTFISQQEDALQGPLTAIGNDGAHTTLTIATLQGEQTKHAVITAGTMPTGSTEIAVGKVFISGTLSAAVAYRPNGQAAAPATRTAGATATQRLAEATGQLQTNDACVALLKNVEGCILHAYDDANDQPINPGDVVYGTLTICYGHTGDDVFPGLIWSQTQADQALTNDIATVVNQVRPLITVPLTDNQSSALVSFAFNIGISAFGGSSVLHLVNAGNFAAVPAAMAQWDKTTVNGHLVVSPGLQNRRTDEIALWNQA